MEADADAAIDAAWQRVRARRGRMPASPRRLHPRIAAAVVAVHGAVLLVWWLAPEPPAPMAAALQLQFVMPSVPLPPPPPPPPVASTPPVPAPSRAPLRSARLPSRSTSPAQVEIAAPARAPPRASDDAPRVSLFRDDGSLALPAEALDALEAVTRDDRVFDYALPARVEAERFLQRRPALDYEATRLDAHWAQPRDIVTSALATAAERTTLRGGVAMFGKPGTRVVCTLSVLSLSGGCGVEDDRLRPVERDDPHTLDAAEQHACAALWEEIVAATRRDRWRQLMDRYDDECRKPHAAPPE